MTELASDTLTPPEPSFGNGSLPGDRPDRQRRRRRSQRLRRGRRIMLAVGVVVALLITTALVGAATSPGNESYSAKLADWLRSHHASALVTPVESWYYQSQAPTKGGRPQALNALPPAAPTTTAPPATPSVPAPPIVGPLPSAVTPHLPPPANLPLVVSPALPGEGQWQAVGPLVHGRPGMYEAQFRADSTYTSQITSAVWIDPKALALSLVPGSREPGGSWSEPPDLSGPAEAAALAAFNGGFRFADAHGGFYLDGRQAVPLRDGAASVVISADGKVDIGAWGSEVSMKPGVKAVLQNLVPIVDHGQPAPSATYKDASIWGTTVRTATVVPRSGLGVTANGGLVYVAGPALTALTLAESLQRAGAVRAMALDLNPEWVTFNFFNHTDPSGATTATKLYPSMRRPAERYLGPTSESRDFFVVSQPPSS
ncbi:MAG: phosphodiester glycosidase family protein [Actinomycetota bacterium]|nr:phosphodiester glycosidase family protein [Actinomycetota bacterium]